MMRNSALLLTSCAVDEIDSAFFKEFLTTEGGSTEKLSLTNNQIFNGVSLSTEYPAI